MLKCRTGPNLDNWSRPPLPITLWPFPWGSITSPVTLKPDPHISLCWRQWLTYISLSLGWARQIFTASAIPKNKIHSGPCVRTIVPLNNRVKAALAKALYSRAHTSQSLNFDKIMTNVYEQTTHWPRFRGGIRHNICHPLTLYSASGIYVSNFWRGVLVSSVAMLDVHLIFFWRLEMYIDFIWDGSITFDTWVGQGLADLNIVHNLYTCMHLMNTS